MSAPPAYLFSEVERNLQGLVQAKALSPGAVECVDGMLAQARGGAKLQSSEPVSASAPPDFLFSEVSRHLRSLVQANALSPAVFDSINQQLSHDHAAMAGAPPPTPVSESELLHSIELESRRFSHLAHTCIRCSQGIFALMEACACRTESLIRAWPQAIHSHAWQAC